MEPGLVFPGCCVLPDYCNYNSSGVVLYVGGNYNQNRNHGPFYLNGNYTATNTNGNIGSRHLVKQRPDYGADFRAPLGEDFTIRTPFSTAKRHLEKRRGKQGKVTNN